MTTLEKLSIFTMEIKNCKCKKYEKSRIIGGKFRFHSITIYLYPNMKANRNQESSAKNIEIKNY